MELPLLPTAGMCWRRCKSWGACMHGGMPCPQCRACSSRGHACLHCGAVKEARWEFLVLLPLFDPPRHDTKSTIEACIEKGISVKMVTGALPVSRLSLFPCMTEWIPLSAMQAPDMAAALAM